jgi:putative membrane protein
MPAVTVEGASTVTDPGHPSSGPAWGFDQPKTLLSIPTGEWILLGLISNRGMALVFVAAGLAWEYDLFDRLDIDFKSLVRQHTAGFSWASAVALSAAVVIMALVLLRILSAIWMVLRFHGYQLTRDGDDLRLTCGLLTRVTATVPRLRIQLISVRQTLLQRWLGRASIRIETAGGAGVKGADGEGHATLSRRWFVPIVHVQIVPHILREIRHDMDVDFREATWQPLAPRARARMLRLALIIALLITLVATAIVRPWGAAIGLAAVPLALWHAHREAAFMAYARTNRGMLFRSGAFTRCISATFFDKAQVVSLLESPFDRRYAMATLCIDTAGAGPADHRLRVPYLPKDLVLTLLADVYHRTERAEFSW